MNVAANVSLSFGNTGKDYKNIKKATVLAACATPLVLGATAQGLYTGTIATCKSMPVGARSEVAELISRVPLPGNELARSASSPKSALYAQQTKEIVGFTKRYLPEGLQKAAEESSVCIGDLSAYKALSGSDITGIAIDPIIGNPVIVLDKNNHSYIQPIEEQIGSLAHEYEHGRQIIDNRIPFAINYFANQVDMETSAYVAESQTYMNARQELPDSTPHDIGSSERIAMLYSQNGSQGIKQLVAEAYSTPIKVIKRHLFSQD